jgi:hypothetical protein
VIILYLYQVMADTAACKNGNMYIRLKLQFTLDLF